jgi:tripeptide aminopeptidase
VSLFVELCETASPTGDEAEVAGIVTRRLESLGLTVIEDDTATATGAGCGNLLTRIEGRSDRWVGFCSHLDTVPHDGPIEVVLDEEGVYRSAGDTILGADNKAAVVVMLEIARRYAEEPPPVGIELLFTAAEEQGLLGAMAFESSALDSEMLFVLDLASDIGEVVTVSPTHGRIRAVVTGIEAHAGLAPEKGASAIEAAARAIASMDLGRIDGDTTANIGLIEGGTSGNVVAGRCELLGEARSTVEGRSAEVLREMAERLLAEASELGCEVEFEIEEVFRGYTVPEESGALALAEQALLACGHQPTRVPTGGGSDANAFRAKGIDALLLANGTYDNHTAEESVPRANLSAMLEVCGRIVEGAAPEC